MTPEVSGFNGGLLGGTVTLKAKGARAADIEGLYAETPEESEPCDLTAVPYYTWGNRGKNSMRVWMDRI